MDNQDSEIANIRSIFSEARFSPKFHTNPKFAGKMPYIAYDDVMADRYVIRAGDDDTIMNSFANKMNEVISSYDSIEALVEDGWCLD